MEYKAGFFDVARLVLSEFFGAPLRYYRMMQGRLEFEHRQREFIERHKRDAARKDALQKIHAELSRFDITATEAVNRLASGTESLVKPQA